MGCEQLNLLGRNEGKQSEEPVYQGSLEREPAISSLPSAHGLSASRHSSEGKPEMWC